jgi:hypothetical protein
LLLSSEQILKNYTKFRIFSLRKIHIEKPIEKKSKNIFIEYSIGYAILKKVSQLCDGMVTTQILLIFVLSA